MKTKYPHPKYRKTTCFNCGKVKDDCLKITALFTPWGHNCFECNWLKTVGKFWICRECEDNDWVFCNGCNALVDMSNYGSHLPDDFDNLPLCPECVNKEYGHNNRIVDAEELNKIFYGDYGDKEVTSRHIKQEA